MRKQLPVSLSKFEIIAGWIYWGVQLLILPVVIILVLDALRIQLDDAQINFIYFCLNFVSITLLLGKYCLATCKQGFQRFGFTLQSAALGLAGIQSSNVLFNILILTLKPDFANLNDNTISLMLEEHYGLIYLGTVFLVPVAEELLYRGVIFGSLYNRSKVAAYIVSSAVFSLVHLLGYIPQYDLLTFLLTFLQYLPCGICLGWAYARSGSLVAPVLVHMTINQLAVLSMSFLR